MHLQIDRLIALVWSGARGERERLDRTGPTRRFAVNDDVQVHIRSTRTPKNMQTTGTYYDDDDVPIIVLFDHDGAAGRKHGTVCVLSIAPARTRVKSLSSLCLSALRV